VLYEIGETMLSRLLDRTSRGIDVNGQSFQKYGAATTKRREKKGKRTDVVNLQDTGAMLKALSFVITDDTVIFYFNNNHEAAKAFFHSFAGVGKDTVVRRFFDFSDDDISVARDIISAHLSRGLQSSILAKFKTKYF
jgi:hypothetical protein